MRPSIRTALPVVLIASMLGALAPAHVAAQRRHADVSPAEYSRIMPAVTVINTQALGELATGPGIGLGLSIAAALDPGVTFARVPSSGARCTAPSRAAAASMWAASAA